jgi:hypothetical protein
MWERQVPQCQSVSVQGRGGQVLRSHGNITGKRTRGTLNPGFSLYIYQYTFAEPHGSTYGSINRGIVGFSMWTYQYRHAELQGSLDFYTNRRTLNPKFQYMDFSIPVCWTPGFNIRIYQQTYNEPQGSIYMNLSLYICWVPGSIGGSIIRVMLNLRVQYMDLTRSARWTPRGPTIDSIKGT